MYLHMRLRQGLLSAAVAFLVAGQSRMAQAATESLNCSSAPGEKRHCPANTSAGIVLSRSTGTVACLLGRNWGYDDQSVWVQDGCGAEFVVAAAAPVSATSDAPPVAAPDGTKE